MIPYITESHPLCLVLPDNMLVELAHELAGREHAPIAG